jgi:hypothetical protein
MLLTSDLVTFFRYLLVGSGETRQEFCQMAWARGRGLHFWPSDSLGSCESYDGNWCCRCNVCSCSAMPAVIDECLCSGTNF